MTLKKKKNKEETHGTLRAKYLKSLHNAKAWN